MAVTWKKIAFTDSALIPASVDLNAGALRLPSNTSALTTTESYLAWESTRKVLRLYDASRERTIGHVGWQIIASPSGSSPALSFSASSTLPIVSGGNGGAITAPIELPSHMLLQSVCIWNRDTASLRTAEWRLYEDRSNTSNTLNEIAGANGTWSFTPTIASQRTSGATGAPVYLSPGCYWLVIRNTSTAQTFTMGIQGTPTIGPNLLQTKTIAALGSTLDFVAATWTKQNQSLAAFLLGRVFGQAAAF